MSKRFLLGILGCILFLGLGLYQLWLTYDLTSNGVKVSATYVEYCGRYSSVYSFSDQTGQIRRVCVQSFLNPFSNTIVLFYDPHNLSKVISIVWSSVMGVFFTGVGLLSLKQLITGKGIRFRKKAVIRLK